MSLLDHHIFSKFSAVQKKFLVSLFFFLDAAFGLSSGVSIFSVILEGEVVWLLQSLELILSSIFLIYFLVGIFPSDYSKYVIFLSPLLFIASLAFCFELLFEGQGKSTTINYNLASIVFTTLYWSAAYLTIATGLTLTYKVQKFGNFAQAEMMLFGAFIAISLSWSDYFHPGVDKPSDGVVEWSLLLWAIILAFFLTGFLGVLIDRLVYKRFRRKNALPQVMMIASLGVSMILRSLLYLRFDAKMRLFVPDRDWRLVDSAFKFDTSVLSFNFGKADVSFFDYVTELSGEPSLYALNYTKTALIIGALTLVFSLLLLLNKTRLGSQMRAVADNPDLAASSGINVNQIHSTSAFLSAGISGVGGVLFAMVTRVNPEVGFSILLPSFAVIVLGTLGSIRGALIASLLVGFIRVTAENTLIGIGSPLARPSFSAFAEITPYLFLIGVLLLLPQGIGHYIEKWTIERDRKKGELLKEKAEWDLMRYIFTFCGLLFWSLTLINVSPHFSLNFAVVVLMIFAGFVVLALAFKWPNKHQIHGSESVTLSSSEFKDTLFIYQKWIKEVISANLAHATDFFGSRYNKARKYIGDFLSSLISVQNKISELYSKYKDKWYAYAPYGRESNNGSWFFFFIFLMILFYISWSLPSFSHDTKISQLSRIVILLSVFGLMSFALNLHTGFTGLTNFGVIFFVGLGGVTVALLTIPEDKPGGHGWSPLWALIFAIFLTSLFGYLLAYPTARLRMDYFAIVTISLGEILRVSLLSEPLLAAGTPTSAVGISNYELPLKDWWASGPNETVGLWLNLTKPAVYHTLLAIIGISLFLFVWFLLEVILSSPFGRVLRAIREDEEVAQHHGYDVLKFKAMSLALGAGIAALAGALWIWLNGNIFPEFVTPVRSTFLVWAAFILGGRGNNRGMLIGAFVIVIVDFLFNTLVSANSDSTSSLHDFSNSVEAAYIWIITDVMGIFMSERSITEVFGSSIQLTSSGFAYIKLCLVGLTIVISLLLSEKGLLPEIPNRPEDPSLVSPEKGGDN